MTLWTSLIQVRVNSSSHTTKKKDGVFWKRIRKEFDYIKIPRIIEATSFPQEYKNWILSLYLKQSVTRRFALIDCEILENDKDYVYDVVTDFLQRLGYANIANKKDLYIFKGDSEYKELKKVLEIILQCNINSIERFEDEQINPQSFFIILDTFDKRIVANLKYRGLKTRIDYYYPEADIYYEIKRHAKIKNIGQRENAIEEKSKILSLNFYNHVDDANIREERRFHYNYDNLWLLYNSERMGQLKKYFYSLKDKKVALYGAGHISDYLIDKMREYEMSPVLVLDSKLEKGSLNGIKIVNISDVEEIIEKEHVEYIINTIEYYKESVRNIISGINYQGKIIEIKDIIRAESNTWEPY